MVASPTVLHAVSPAGTGIVGVSVSNAGGTSTGGPSFGYSPTVTGVNPDVAPPAGGTTVTITGTGFDRLRRRLRHHSGSQLDAHLGTTLAALVPAGTPARSM